MVGFILEAKTLATVLGLRFDDENPRLPEALRTMTYTISHCTRALFLQDERVQNFLHF